MSIQDEFAAYLEQRAEEIKAAPETPAARRYRIAHEAADTLDAAFNRPRPAIFDEQEN